MSSRLPFTADQFLSVFERYNEAVWPAEPVAYALAIVAAASLFHRQERVQQLAALTLAAMWVWTGVIYHWLFFAPINGAAWLFGLLFVIEGVWLWMGAPSGQRLRFSWRGDFGDLLGSGLIVYAMFLYPAAGTLSGDSWPRAPSFGITPCPLTLFTLGMLLFARPSLSLWAIPLLWSLIGGAAALLLGMVPDWPLLVAGPAIGLVLLRRRRRIDWAVDVRRSIAHSDWR
jgi:hypothetical protein